MNLLRIAVVGAGAIGRRHIELLAADPACTLAAIADPTPAAKALADSAGVPHHASLSALLAGTRPDAVIVATPNHLHVDNALACLAAGVPALIEKPVARTMAAASSPTRHHAVEDTMAILLRFAGGALGTFIVSDAAGSARSWEQTSRENKAYATYPDEDCYVLAGTRGSLSFPTMRIKRYVHDEDRSWWTPMLAEKVAVTRDDPLVRQLAHFCAVVRGEVAPLVTVQDGVQNLRVVDAIVEAARTHGVVELAAAAVATP